MNHDVRLVSQVGASPNRVTPGHHGAAGHHALKNTANDVTGSAGYRFDYESVTLLPDGHIAVTFDDSTPAVELFVAEVKAIFDAAAALMSKVVLSALVRLLSVAVSL